MVNVTPDPRKARPRVTALIRGRELPFELNSHPDACPICHTAIIPIRLHVRILENDSADMEILYACPNHACDRGFLGYFRSVNNVYFFKNSAPFKESKEVFPPEIESLSPLFVEIYNQAKSAEHYELDQISGMGYRK